MRWIIRRIILLVLTLFVAVTLTFFLVRLMPGSPVDQMINELVTSGYSYEQALTMVQQILQFLPSKPIHEQYADFLKGILSGNLGYSIRQSQPVTVILSYAIPWTVFSVSVSLIISFVLGTVLGMYIAYRRGSILDRFLSLYSAISQAIPVYIFGFFILLVFALQLKWFPTSGPYSPYLKPGLYAEFLLSVLHHAFLPVVTYVLTSVGGWILTMKGSTISVLGEYYVTAAEARGLSERRIITTYVGRNAIMPLFTRFAISVGYMFSGVVFIERLFLYPGIGTYLSVSISQRDYPLMTGCFLISTVAVVLANFLADLLYSRLDPRVKLE